VSPLSLSGLASGLDTETIITQLLSVERQPRTRLELQDTQAQARQTQLRDLAAKLAAVRDAANALRSTTTWTDVQSVTSADATRIGVRALPGSAAPGTRLLEVTTLASKDQHTFDYTTSPTATSLTFDWTDNGVVPPVPHNFALGIDAGADIATVASAINSSTDVPVKAVVAGGKLVLTSKTSGAGGSFTVSGAPLSNEVVRAGADAAYKIDGVAKTSTSNVITDAVLGVELTLKSTTSAPVAIGVSDPAVDTDGVKTKVKAFVSAYNTAVDLIRNKLAEKPVPGATTAADANKGLFFGDSMLTGMLSSMRSSIGDLSDLGISTGAASGVSKFSADSVSGHLTVDDTKLSAAFAGDPAALATRIKAFGDRVVAAIAPASGSPIDARLSTEEATRKRLATSMAAVDTRLALRERNLRAQFTAMETALAAAQAAQSQLQSQLSALG
jgi:flagellar hook-associated protein 2